MGLRRCKPFWAKKKAGGGSTFVLPNASDVELVFSIRQYDTYVGNCLRVVRASDSTSLDIGFIGGVLDTSSIDTFCSGTTGKVDRWYDQSGNGFIAVNPTDSTRPIIYTGGSVVTQGGKPALNFGTGSFLEFTNTSIESAFFVYKLTSIQGLNTLAMGNTNSQMWAGGTAISGVNGFTIWTGSVAVSNTSENTNYNLSSYFAGSDDRIDTNNSDPATAGSSIATLSLLRLGRNASNLSLNGVIQESIFYATSQFSEKSTIENMINSYYSIY